MYIVLACLFVQGGHSYLLFSQKHDRKWSISDHASVSARTHLLYFAGHFLGGLSWLIASYLVFYPSHLTIFWISTITVLLEWLQAALPSKKGRIRSWHSIFAYVMWIGCMVTLLLGSFALALPTWQRLLALLCFVPIFGMFIYMHLRRERIYHLRRERIYHLQYTTIYFFFLGMVALSL